MIKNLDEVCIDVSFMKNKSFGIGEVQNEAKLFTPSLDL